MTDVAPSLGEVAARAGVSKATASKVFNGRSDVSTTTRSRVVRVAQELGYKPPMRGAADQTQVWVVFDTLANHYAGHVIDGLLAEAQNYDAQVPVAEWRFAGDRGPVPASPEWIRRGIDRGAGAYILITTPVGPEHVEACGGEVPLIVVDPASQAPREVLSIGATNWRGGVQATEHLIGLGHRRIAFVGAMLESTPGGERLAGFRFAMESAGIKVDPAHVVPGQFNSRSGFACREILGQADRPTAIFAASDSVALGVLQAAHEVGLRVPDDLSVIGFDDSYAAVAATPPLTTVRQPLMDMGRLAMRSAMTFIRGEQRIGPHVELATTLVERASTAPVTTAEGRRTP
jgi:LacI family transcriptional regulator